MSFYRPWRWILLVPFLLIFTICAVWFYQRTTGEDARQAVLFNKEQMQDADFVARKLDVAQLEAQELVEAYNRKDTKPAVSFIVKAQSLEKAAEQVKGRINSHDPSLPLAAQAESDRTVVVKNDTAYKVDVLKINLDKSWEISLGLGSHQGDVYVPVAMQRNYDDHRAVAVEFHMAPEDVVRVKIKTSGWEVKHVWRY